MCYDVQFKKMREKILKKMREKKLLKNYLQKNYY